MCQAKALHRDVSFIFQNLLSKPETLLIEPKTEILNELHISAPQSIHYCYLGQVDLPSNKGEIVVQPGSAARIGWTYVGDPSRATLFWYFTSRNAGSKEEELAVKFRTNDAVFASSSLPNISVEDPATLVLNSVNASYNGKYRFLVLVAGGSGESSVEFYVVGKF